MERKELSDKILEGDTEYFNSEEFKEALKQELIKFHSSNDVKGTRKLVESVFFAYENVFKGYKHEGSESFKDSRRDLDNYAEQADELMGFEESKEIQNFYRKAVGYVDQEELAKKYFLLN